LLPLFPLLPSSSAPHSPGRHRPLPLPHHPHPAPCLGAERDLRRGRYDVRPAPGGGEAYLPDDDLGERGIFWIKYRAAVCVKSTT